MTYIKDITEKKYREITESSFTPLKLRAEWAQKTRENLPVVQLFIAKNSDLEANEYFLMLGVPSGNDYVVLSYKCEQPPTFVIGDVCDIIVNNTQFHGNNTYLINQHLNGCGYKNLEHLIMDIFTQEMILKMSQYYRTDTAVLFNDYSYLIQKAISDIQATLNSLTLADHTNQNFFFFMLAVEESMLKLNQEFMFLYFCFFKLADQSNMTKGAWQPVLKNLKRSYQQKIDQHIHALHQSLTKYRNRETDGASQVTQAISTQLEQLLSNLGQFQKKEAYLNEPLFK